MVSAAMLPSLSIIKLSIYSYLSGKIFKHPYTLQFFMKLSFLHVFQPNNIPQHIEFRSSIRIQLTFIKVYAGLERLLSH